MSRAGLIVGAIVAAVAAAWWFFFRKSADPARPDPGMPPTTPFDPIRGLAAAASGAPLTTLLPPGAPTFLPSYDPLGPDVQQRVRDAAAGRAAQEALAAKAGQTAAQAAATRAQQQFIAVKVEQEIDPAYIAAQAARGFYYDGVTNTFKSQFF